MDGVSNGWGVAPDYKFTRVDDVGAALVGAYGGQFIDHRLVGGGAHWLSGTLVVGITYGGGLVKWFGNPGGLLDFSVRGFVGLGTAMLSERLAFSDGCDAFSVFNPDVSGTGDTKGGLPIGAAEPCGPAVMLDAFVDGGRGPAPIMTEVDQRRVFRFFVVPPIRQRDEQLSLCTGATHLPRAVTVRQTGQGVVETYAPERQAVRLRLIPCRADLA
ncbi:MAG: hypothetical protein OXQ29_03035 [Rhodospirillaceae bacterium]|nr:hypothetical protein [Rhodospirillaceae bacterium]